MKILQLILECCFMLVVSCKSETVADYGINNTSISWDATNHSAKNFKGSSFPVRPLLNDSKTRREIDANAKAENIENSSRDIKELIREKCPKFKYTKTQFDIQAMPDIWQTAYYALPKKMQCFKIHIKKLSHEERRLNELKYGNYSGKVNWTECSMQVHSASAMSRMHYLQGGNVSYGVMDNVIIEKIPPASDNSDPSYVLLEESPDQWLVLNNLMLMRDCHDGGTVVFSRVPWRPGQVDIQNALREFGEDKINGKMACYDEEVVNKSFEEDDENNSSS